MQNILSVDVEDWFHIVDVEGTPPVKEWDHLESRIEVNLGKLLDLFDSRQVQATCFFLGWVAERYPRMVRDAAARGHEIACHGYAHQTVGSQGQAGFRADIRKSKDLLEQAAGVPVKGYRAPSFSITPVTSWALTELVEAGFGFDSSIFPTTRGNGGWPGASLSPVVLRTPSGPITEFPISVYECMGQRICLFGGGYLRLFPSWMIERASASLHRAGRPVVYYIHPREIDPRQPRLPMSRVREFKSYVNLATTARKLQGLIDGGPITGFSSWMNANPIPALRGAV